MKESLSISACDERNLAEGGFTLIEILIAITLLAFISIGVISVTQNAANTMERTTESNKNNLQIETAMSRFEWDFSQIYSPMYFSQAMDLTPSQDTDGDGLDDLTRQPVNAASMAAINQELMEFKQKLQARFDQSETFFGLSADSLPVPRFQSPEKTIFEFFTASNRRKLENTRQSHFAWVRYSLGEPIAREATSNAGGEDKTAQIPQGLKTLVRYFSADDPYDDKRINTDITSGTGKAVKASVLLENVESLEFQFWDYARKKWENNLKTIQNGETIIRGVKVLVTWYDSNGLKRTAERIFRNSWPMVIPNDKPAPRNTGSASAGTSGGNTGAPPGGFTVDTDGDGVPDAN